uniref:Transposase n=1 Tax=Steinernema glaseri TaxID=37863 RepID=A0A1I7ZVF7_9BILA
MSHKGLSDSKLGQKMVDGLIVSLKVPCEKKLRHRQLRRLSCLFDPRTARLLLLRLVKSAKRADREDQGRNRKTRSNIAAARGSPLIGPIRESKRRLALRVRCSISAALAPGYSTPGDVLNVCDRAILILMRSAASSALPTPPANNDNHIRGRHRPISDAARSRAPRECAKATIVAILIIAKQLGPQRPTAIIDSVLSPRLSYLPQSALFCPAPATPNWPRMLICDEKFIAPPGDKLSENKSALPGPGTVGSDLELSAHLIHLNSDD